MKYTNQAQKVLYFAFRIYNKECENISYLQKLKFVNEMSQKAKIYQPISWLKLFVYR